MERRGKWGKKEGKRARDRKTGKRGKEGKMGKEREKRGIERGVEGKSPVFSGILP